MTTDFDVHAAPRGDATTDVHEVALRLQDFAITGTDPRALLNVTLAVPRGSVCAIIGDDAALASTLLDAIAGLVPPVAGRRELGDSSLAYLHRGQVPASGNLRVRDVFAYHAALLPSWDVRFAEHVAAALGLALGARLSGLSAVANRELQLTLVLAGHPGLLVADDPFSGFPPTRRDAALACLLDAMADREMTVILSDPQVTTAERLADWLVVFRGARLRYSGSRARLMDETRRYLLRVPPDWSGIDGRDPSLECHSVERSGDSATVVARGIEANVRGRLRQSGVELRAVESLRFAEVLGTLMSRIPPEDDE